MRDALAVALVGVAAYALGAYQAGHPVIYLDDLSAVEVAWRSLTDLAARAKEGISAWLT